MMILIRASNDYQIPCKTKPEDNDFMTNTLILKLDNRYNVLKI